MNLVYRADTKKVEQLPTMSFMKKTTLIAAAVILALAGGAAWWWSKRADTAQVQYRTGKIERGNLQATVSASGAVNPVTQVSVGTQVSGQIKELLVDFNSEVKAGQLIAQIDPETFEYRVRQAQADVDASRAAVLTAQANVSAAQASVSRAQVDLSEAQRDAERKADLVAKEFIAKSEADKARALVNTTTELLKSAQAQLGVAQAQVKSAQANVAQREAALSQARVDLSRTRITSPVNGIVIKRAVEKGQTVAASLQAPELFVIAQNLSDMQVDASVDEADVSRIRTGMRASFTVDAFPGQTFEGEVRQVRKAAQNVSNVITYVAVINFNNANGRLLPGMTANVRVVTESRENVLKVPNAALRVRIAGVEPARSVASAPNAPANGASGTRTGWLDRVMGVFSSAYAQPAPGGQGPGGGGGGLAAMRERLITELQLSDEQKTKLDAISQDMRPQFMALRDMDEAQRSAARDKIMGEMRSQISAMLTPEQRKKYQEMTSNAAQRGSSPSSPNAINSGAKNPDSVSADGTKSPSKSANSAAGAVGAATAAGGVASMTPAAAASSSAPPTAAASAPAGSTAQPSAGGTAGGASGGPMAEMRNRLVSELTLNAAQQGQLDAIINDTRPRFMSLRDVAAEERGKARDRIMADMRARITDILTPEQKTKYAALQADMAQGRSTRGRIYLLGADNKPVAYDVRLGISDGTSTELLVAPGSPNAESLKEGAVVITGTSAAAPSTRPGTPSGPRMPF
jgi:HlyD family secretion protein